MLPARPLLFVVLLLFPLASRAAAGAEIKTEPVKAAALPKALLPKDPLDFALRWSDTANGTNYLVSALRESKGDDERSSFLTVTHAVCAADGSSCKVLRQIKDAVEQCGEDLTLEIDGDSITVTDLDGNGFSEVAFAYRRSCKGDVSPDELKLMLLEKGEKYAIRGETAIKLDGKTIGGGMKPDSAAFKKAPPAFLEHAKALFKKASKPTSR
jgi:hypothetical protein